MAKAVLQRHHDACPAPTSDFAACIASRVWNDFTSTIDEIDDTDFTSVGCGVSLDYALAVAGTHAQGRCALIASTWGL